MPRDEDAAVTAAAALFESEEEDTEEPVAEQESEEVAEAPQETEETEEDLFAQMFEHEVPADLLAELEVEEPTDDNVIAELEQDEEYLTLDEEGRRLMARALAAEKKAAYYEDLRVKEATKGWVAEAKKFFPLSAPFLEEINANSRRGFLREAKARHEAVLPLVKPITDQAKAEILKVRKQIEEEERDKAKERWGGAPSEGGTPTEASITQEELNRNRSKGDLSSTIRAMIFPTKKES